MPCGLCERLHFLLKSIQKICEDHLYKKLQSGLNAELLVKELIEQIDTDAITFKKAEEKIVEFINKFGHFLFQEVASNCKEPVIEDRVIVNGNMKYAMVSYQHLPHFLFKVLHSSLTKD